MTGQDRKQELFTGLPRRRYGAAIVIGTWLVLAAAFIGDLVLTKSSAGWLYDLEARRSEYGRASTAEQSRADEVAARARRAARAPPTHASAPSVDRVRSKPDALFHSPGLKACGRVIPDR